MQIMSKVLEKPLLSGSFRNFVENFQQTHHNPILDELLCADLDIAVYNELDETSNLHQFLLNRINETITDYCRAITYRAKEFTLSFTPKGKELIYSSDGVWSNKDRQIGKPIRVIQKLIKKKFTNKEYEDLGNLLKSALLEESNFEIVCGQDITYWYHEDNIVNSGSLGNSCMIHDSCRSFFSVYEDHAKMLVLFDADKSLIRGRAILWEIDGKTYMDRIYTCDDYLVTNFIEYAKEHKFCYRENNVFLESGYSVSWYTPDDDYKEPVCLDLKIKNVRRYVEWPYMDSFRYYNPNSKTLTSYPTDSYFTLDCTDGSYEEVNDVECDQCGFRDSDEDMLWCDRYERWYCPRCATYSTYENDYVPNNDAIVINAHTLEQDIVFISTTIEDENIIESDGKFYTKDCDEVEFNEEKQEY